jgi:hypothetical protein
MYTRESLPPMIPNGQLQVTHPLCCYGQLITGNKLPLTQVRLY